MKSKKLCLLCGKKQMMFIFLIFLGFSGFTQTKPHSSDKQKPESLITENFNPLYIRGVITLKLKKGIGEFGKQTGTVHFGILTLDDKVAQFEVYQLEKRFRYNPAKLREGLPDLSRIYKISFPDKYSLSEIVNAFSSDPNVEYAEPIPVYHTAEVPNDDLFSQLQHLPQIHAPEAWDIHKGENGTEEIVIAIIDTGVDWDHVDLQSNVWQNMAEDADNDGHTMEFNGTQWGLDPGDLNGIDNDLNGFIDDLIGWNFITNNGNPNPIHGNPSGYHGTHCAGISNGVTNNGTGIASISWNLSVMGICADENNTLAYGWDGIIYAAENGADIISNSWGGSAYSIVNQEVVTYATGLGSIVVAAAHNYNNQVLIYPAGYTGVISVASVSVDDTKTSYSNYNLAVDISAPGGGTEGGILSTLPGNTYGLLSGTSMATPLVAGCFGLLKSYHPEWTNEQLIIQILGTADNIDTINPGYENLLGTGRVNAFRSLSEENVTMPQVLKLSLISISYEDANGNQINEPGEVVTLNLEFRNFVPFVGDDEATATMTTEDPEVNILIETATVDIPPDGIFTIEDQFQFVVSEEATSHFASFTITFDSESEIVCGKEQIVEVLVAPAGIFIYEGEPNGQDYSGTYVKDILDQMDIVNTYSNTYPQTLLGFETAFLSHGNFGQTLSEGTMITEEHSLICQEFLENGGNLYIEAGGLFTGMQYFAYPNYAAMKQLFGVSSNQLVLEEHPLDSLIGGESSPFDGIVFTESNQLFNWYIDKLTPVTEAIIPFYEYGYGNVSIMYDGSASYGHKVFYFGYSLAELVDTDAINSKNNVLLKVLDFFEILPENYILASFIANKSVGEPPLQVQFADISLSDPAYPILSWQWDFDNDGTIDSEDQNPAWTYSIGGSYDVKLIVSNGLNSDTLILEELISVNFGYLVYEGVIDGNDYSGTFIRDYLQEHVYHVTYRNILPESLEGYSAVFLSFGNYESGNTVLDNQMANIIIDYLEGGGYVYLEGGDALGYDQVANTQLLELFGLASATDGTSNPINSLEGQPDALTNEMLFTGNNQLSNSWIDIYVPSANARVAFTESDYGTVAVENYVPDGHRTFCFSYALSCLTDVEYPNTREELLNRILNFFDIYTSAPDGRESNAMSCNVFPNPFNNSTSIEYHLKENTSVTLTLFNHLGQEVGFLADEKQTKGTHRVQWNAADLPPGVYYCRMQAGKETITKKIIKVKQ